MVLEPKRSHSRKTAQHQLRQHRPCTGDRRVTGRASLSLYPAHAEETSFDLNLCLCTLQCCHCEQGLTQESFCLHRDNPHRTFQQPCCLLSPPSVQIHYQFVLFFFCLFVWGFFCLKLLSIANSREKETQTLFQMIMFRLNMNASHSATRQALGMQNVNKAKTLLGEPPAQW